MIEVALLVLAFALGVFFSLTETVYTVFDRILAISWLRARRFGARTVRFLSAHPERFLATTLIGNNISNVAYSSLLVLLAGAAGVNVVWLITLSPLFILIFSEIVPKMLGYALANRLVRWLSPPLLTAYYILSPLRILLLPLTRLVARNPAEKDQESLGEPLTMRRDLDQILVGAQAEGAATPEEGEILSRYLDAREMKVRQIMTPRTAMVAVSAELSPEQIREVFRRCRHNILPVYRGDLDHVIGYVRARDLLEPNPSIPEVLRPIHAVPESKRVSDLLQEFRAERRQAALVIDEYGGTDGLVTLKDIFEELVGPVAERFDPDQPVIKRIASGKYLVSGSADLGDIERVTGWTPPTGQANTVAGLVAEHLGRIAEAGEDVEIEGAIVRVIRRSPRRVEGCLLKVPVRQAEGQETEA
jgi:putative hemolysin